jgi:hypothetical protein
MTDLAVVGIRLQTDEVERGEKIVVKAFGNMEAARAKESATAQAAARAEREATQAVQETARALNSAGVSSLEFSRALRATGGASSAVAAEINKMSAIQRENAAATVQATQAHHKAADAIKATDSVTTRATPGLKSLQTNLGSLAIAAGGLPGPLGRTAQALSTFAFGGGPAVAIIAGISAVAFAFDKIEGPARKAREETDKLIESLREKMRLESGEAARADGRKLEASLAEAEAATLRAERSLTAYTSRGASVRLVAEAQELVRIRKAAEAELRVIRDKFANDLALQTNAAAIEGFNEEQAATDRRNAERLKREMKAGDDMAKVVEANLARIRLLTYGKPITIDDPLTPRVVGGQGFSLGFQTRRDAADRVRNSPLLTPDAIDTTGREVESRLSAAYDEAARNLQRGLTSAFEGLITGAPDIGKQLGSAITSGVAGVLSAGVTDALSDAFNALPATTKSKIKEVAAGAVVGAGVGYSTGSTGLGALSGVAAGAAFGPAGAIVGGVAGIVGGLLGSSKQAAEAARQMEEARKAFGLALDAYTAEAFGTATNLSRNIANANRLGDELKRQAPKPVLGSADADEVRRFVRDLDEYTKALGKVDEATKATIASIEAEEKVRLEMIGLSLDEREARLAGNDRGALEARAAREEAEVQRQLRNGEITQAIANRTSAVISGELAKSIADLGKEAEEAAKQIEEANASFATSLVGRELQARARLATSDAEREGIEDMIRAEQYRLEIEAAIADGISETNIAALKRIQGLEEEAVAMERSKKAEEDRLRIIKESTAFLDDLKVREFRATGQGAAADEYAQRERDRQELIKAAEFGSEYVMETLRVQGLERADRDAQRRAQQDAAFGDAFGTSSTSLLPDSRTSVNLAVGTSESTTNRLVGVVQSQVVLQQRMVVLQENLTVLPQILAALRGGIVTVVDEGLAVAGADADLGAGVVPGNR